MKSILHNHIKGTTTSTITTTSASWYIPKMMYYNKMPHFNQKEQMNEKAQRDTTYDAKEQLFFNNLHIDWWDIDKNDKICDKFGRLVGSGMYSLHDYNEQRFNFIFQNFEFIYFEKLKRENTLNKIRDEQKEKNADKKEIEELRILDVGCGGGILCEYMKKHIYQFFVKRHMLFSNKNLKAKKWNIYIDGIDVSEKLIEVANRRKHQKEEEEKIERMWENGTENKGEHCNIHLNYKNCDITELIHHQDNENENESENKNKLKKQHCKENGKSNIFYEELCKEKKKNSLTNDKYGTKEKKEMKYDIVISSEVIEHIPNEKKEMFIKYISMLSKDNTIVVFTTINKNVLSYLYSIVLAEYITGMIKRGTHEYDKFISDDELKSLCFRYNLNHLKTKNVIYLPFLRNYFTTNKLKLLYLSSFIYKRHCIKE